MGKLKNNIAVVTGASRGLGAELATGFTARVQVSNGNSARVAAITSREPTS